MGPAAPSWFQLSEVSNFVHVFDGASMTRSAPLFES